MKKINILIAISLILLVIGYSDFREFMLIKRANKLSTNNKYTEADSAFKEVAFKYDSSTARSNSVINLYEGKLYKELLDTTSGLEFFRGNSEVYLTEKEQDTEAQIEGYRKALEEYRFAMKESDDINIKKNYEIVSKRIEKLQNQQQENQKDQEKKDNQNQDNNKDNDQNKDSEEQQENQDKNNDSDKGEQSQSNKQDQSEKSDNNKEQQNNEKEQGNNESEEQEGSTEIKEALATLERLENSEEQAFKNNERLEYLGGDTDESW